jgi:hypothetical protein
MMSKGPLVIKQQDVALAWLQAFDEITKPGTDEIVPLVVCVTGFDNSVVAEDINIRELLDGSLAARGLQSIRTVANTIFPASLWNPDLPAGALFARYARLAKKLRSYKLNHNGIYFQRMIDFHPKDTEKGVNQLEYILSTRAAGNPRRSAYQISIIDPTHDHTDQRRRGFPCLQQVSVTPIDGNELSITGLYATQTMFERAYGNYIGLCDLGRFFAHYWGLQLSRVTCVSSVAQLDTDNIGKRDARELATRALGLVATPRETAAALSED